MGPGQWPLPGPDWRLASREIAVFLVSTDTASQWSPVADADRRELHRWRRAADQARFLAGRGALRAILGRIVGEPPPALEFRVTPRGRPYLDPRHRRSDLDFSLSHAGDFVLIAVGLGGRVGADIEFGRRHVDVAAVGRLVFTADEQQRLAGCGNDADRHDLFFRLWVRKEAVAKADGRGLAAIVQPFPVSGDAGKTVVSLADEGGIVRQWRLFDLELPPGYYGALASDLPGPPRRFAGCPEHLAARPDSSAPLRT